MLLAIPRGAMAQPQGMGQRAAHAPGDARPPSPKRARPDYDGRPQEPGDAGDALLWVPRVLAFIPYVAWEYAIRRPVGWLVVTAERDDWPTKILDFFTFGEDRKAGLVPTAFFDFGFNASVGLYFFADDVGANGNDVRANVGFWGLDWLKLSARDRIELDDDSFVQIGGGWLRRPDYLFHGIGPRTLDGSASRYGADEATGFLGYDLSLWRLSALRPEIGVRDMSFRGSGWGDEPGVEARVLAGAFELPEGFEQGYTAGYARLRASLDTRRPDAERGDGIRVEGAVEQGTELDPDRAANRWVKYGGTAGGFLDLNGRHRVLSLRLSAQFVDPAGGVEQVPFTELAFLGGSGEMRVSGRPPHRAKLGGGHAAVRMAPVGVATWQRTRRSGQRVWPPPRRL
jgi:hypothetical protein